MTPGLPGEGDTVLGKYRVERLLGSGGMGSVYAAIHAVTGRRVALKFLLPEAAARAGGVARFLREAEAVGRIQHRHVIDVYDVADDGGLFCIVMPFVDGCTFAELRARGTSMLNALTVLAKAMDGVSAAHAVGVVHRDLKPANILVCRGEDGEYDDPRVVDFGISKVLDARGARLTESGTALGTPSYMALEQLTGATDLDARTDVFAMGLLLYETLTGRLPHRADNIGALAIERATQPIPDVRGVVAGLSEPLADAIMRSLANDRAQRPQSIAEFAAPLWAFLAQGEDARGLVPATSLLQAATTRTGIDAWAAHAAVPPSGLPVSQPRPSSTEPSQTAATSAAPRASTLAGPRWLRRSAFVTLIVGAALAMAGWAFGRATKRDQAPSPAAIPAREVYVPRETLSAPASTSQPVVALEPPLSPGADLVETATRPVAPSRQGSSRSPTHRWRQPPAPEVAGASATQPASPALPADPAAPTAAAPAERPQTALRVEDL